MIYILFDHAARAWVGPKGLRVSSIFDAQRFATQADAQVAARRKGNAGTEVCPWAGA